MSGAKARHEKNEKYAIVTEILL